MTITSKKIAVLMGGWSSERDVSLSTGKAVVTALEELGCTVQPIDVSKDIPALVAALTAIPRPDAIFNALHGPVGEDGTIQGLLNMLEMPYTHSGVLASSVAMDKNLTRILAQDLGIAVPQGKMVTIESLKEQDPMPRPYVVKPNNEGSTCGVEIVQAQDNKPALENWHYGGEALVEQYIPGRELTVAVMGTKAITVTELIPESGFYDYEAKYSEGLTRHILPAELPEDVMQRCLDWALKVHQTLGCRGVSRSDFRYDENKTCGKDLYFLEVNTQPGMTSLSLVPEQAKWAGISFNELVSWLLEQATYDNAAGHKNQETRTKKQA